jgi:hypothetical protein
MIEEERKKKVLKKETKEGSMTQNREGRKEITKKDK